jgi:hypothetical protein
MSTLLYNPGIRISLDTRSMGMIDVTEDIESGSLTLNEGSSHSLNFRLSSAGGKYVGILTPNDRVVVQMKRVTWLQVFSGYLDSVPYFSTFNKSVDLAATCTMKRILYHYWDPGLPQSVALLLSALYSTQKGGNGGQFSSPDAGMGNVIQTLLTEVVGWDPAQMHIGVVPRDFIARIDKIWSSVESSITNSINNLGGLVVGGTFGTAVGSYVAPNMNNQPAPPGTALPATSGFAQEFPAADTWDATLQWGYMAPGVSPAEQQTAEKYLNGADGQGQRLLVANSVTGQCICVSTNGGYMDSSQPQGAINLSAAALKAIGITQPLIPGGPVQGQVSIAWAPTNPVTPFGPFTIPPPAGATKTGTASQSGIATGPNGELLQGDWMPSFANDINPVSQQLDGLRNFMNDTAILPMIQSLAGASLRQFCSAPNGDFIAWFPDYFGVYGTANVWNLETIEMQDFTINWSDANLVTHEFVVGSQAMTVEDSGTSAPSEGTSIASYNMVNSYGVATIDVPGLFQALFGTGDYDNGLFGANAAANIYQQFGARPNYDPLPQIASQGEIEFWYAVYMWMQSWSQQFSANIPLTFLPELFPGFLLRIQEYGFQCYIHSVTHSWDLSEGGGFTTSVNVVAPSSLNQGGLIGLARSGVAD